MAGRLAFDTATTGGLNVWGGGALAESPGVHARLFDVLHHPADDHRPGGVADGVHVHLDGVLQEPVDQHRAFGGHAALPVERGNFMSLLVSRSSS